MFKFNLSVKAVTATVTAFVFNEIGSVSHVALSQGVTAAISSGIALAVAFAVPEGVKYIDAWLAKEGLPAVIDLQAAKAPRKS